MQKIQQGDIYFADLNPVKGHEQGGYRPILILQNNTLNAHLNTVIIAPITKNLKAKNHLTTYFLAKKLSGLPIDSIVLLFQVKTIDKNRLKKFVNSIPAQNFREIKQQLLLVF